MKTIAEVLTPQFREISVAKQGEKHLLLEDGLGRRGHLQLAFAGTLENGLRAFYVRKVEQLEKAIHPILLSEIGEMCIVQLEARARLRRQPFHLRNVGF